MYARKSIPVLAVLATLMMVPLAHAATTAGKPTTPPATHQAKAPAPAKTPAAPKVDLNTAPREELAALPGIGDVKADKIIAARPFKMKSELVSKRIVTKAEYGKLAAHLSTRPAEATKPVHKATKPAPAAKPAETAKPAK